MANLRIASNVVNNAPSGFLSWDDVTAQDKWNTLSPQEKIQTKREYETATGVSVPEIYGKTGDMIPWEQLSSESKYQHLSAEEKATTAEEYESAGGFIPWSGEAGKYFHKYAGDIGKGVASGIIDIANSGARLNPQVANLQQASDITGTGDVSTLTPENVKAKTGFDVIPQTKLGNDARTFTPWLIPGLRSEEAAITASEYIPTKIGQWITKKTVGNTIDAVIPTAAEDAREGKDFSLTDLATNAAINTSADVGLHTIAYPFRPVVSRVVKGTKAYLKGEESIAAKLQASKELYTASQGDLFEHIATHLMQKEGRGTISPNEVLDAWGEANPKMEETGQIDNLRSSVFGDMADAELTPTEIQSRITTAIAEAENNFLDVSIRESESGARSAMDAMIDSEENKKPWQLSLNPLRNDRAVLKELGASPLYINTSRILGIGEKGLLGTPKLLRGRNAQDAITNSLDVATNRILDMIDGLTTHIAEVVNEGHGLTGVAKIEHDSKVKAFVEQKKQAKKMLRATKQAKSRKVNLESLYSYYTEAQQAIFDNPYLIKGSDTETVTQKVRDSLEEVMNLREMSKGASLDAGDLVGLGIELIPHALSLGSTVAGAASATAMKQVLDKAFIRDMKVARDLAGEIGMVIRGMDERLEDSLKDYKDSGASDEEIEAAYEGMKRARANVIDEIARGLMEERREPAEKAIYQAKKLGAALGSTLRSDNKK